MGVNLFALVPTGTSPEEVCDAVNKIGQDHDFDWADLFRGDGGYKLSVPTALAFDDQSAPYMVFKDGIIHSIDVDEKTRNPIRSSWEPLVKNHRGDVIFMKARGCW